MPQLTGRCGGPQPMFSLVRNISSPLPLCHCTLCSTLTPIPWHPCATIPPGSYISSCTIYVFVTIHSSMQRSVNCAIIGSDLSSGQINTWLWTVQSDSESSTTGGDGWEQGLCECSTIHNLSNPSRVLHPLIWTPPSVHPNALSMRYRSRTGMSLSKAWICGHWTMLVWIWMYVTDHCPAGRSSHYPVIVPVARFPFKQFLLLGVHDSICPNKDPRESQFLQQGWFLFFVFLDNHPFSCQIHFECFLPKSPGFVSAASEPNSRSSSL